MPDPTFKTLVLQAQSKHPSKTGPHYPKLKALADPHVQSFNSLFSGGLLSTAIQDIPRTVVYAGDVRVEFWLSNPQVSVPSHGASPMYPSECRERGTSYTAKMSIDLSYRINGEAPITLSRSCGNVPIMVASAKCNLVDMSPAQLVLKHEDAEEFGGYFISNGIERLVRLLIVPRRNYPTALVRNSFMNRGPTYSKFGVAIRCVRPDQTSQTVTLHYCSDGMSTLRFSYRKNEYMVPVMLILRALRETSDKEVFERVSMGDYDDTFLVERLEMLLGSFKRFTVSSKKSCLEYLGEKFAVMLDSSQDSTTESAGLELLRRVLFVHLDTPEQKYDLLIFMLQKLYALVCGTCSADNPDALQFQETLLGGHLVLMIIKENLSDWLVGIKAQISTDVRRTPSVVDFRDKKYVGKILTKTSSLSDVGRKLEYFLATGNLKTGSGLDLQQTTGYTIIAEKLNFYRYISHFRSIHRGSFFAELKTTTVRKLLPESWGFVCPVHTPDGSPCGLLNHLSHTCEIVVKEVDVTGIAGLVVALGAFPISGKGPQLSQKVSAKQVSDPSDQQVYDMRANTLVSIHLDGEVIAWSNVKTAISIASTLRDWKVRGLHAVPLELEIGMVPPSSGGQYPGLYMFSGPTRMIRPVTYLLTGTKDMVGPFEQAYMDIACMNEDVVPGLTTHQETLPTNMLSVVSNLTPFSDFNQSPRNMYQCQMG